MLTARDRRVWSDSRRHPGYPLDWIVLVAFPCVFLGVGAIVLVSKWAASLIRSAGRPEPSPAYPYPSTDPATIGPGLGFAIAAAGAVLVLVVYFVWGREHSPTFSKEYLREVPNDLHPAVVAWLAGMGTVDERAAAATLVDLARREVVDLRRWSLIGEPVFPGSLEPDFLLVVDSAKRPTGDRLDDVLLATLFDSLAGRESVTIEDLSTIDRTDPLEYALAMGAWAAEVGARGWAADLLDPKGETAVRVVVALSALMILIGLALFLATLDPWALLIWSVAAAALVGRKAMRRRTCRGAELMARYAAVGRYVSEVGRLQEKPPDAVAVWGEYMVVATALGMTSDAPGAFDIRVPPFSLDQWYLASTGSEEYYAPLLPVRPRRGGRGETR